MIIYSVKQYMLHKNINISMKGKIYLFFILMVSFYINSKITITHEDSYDFW